MKNKTMLASAVVAPAVFVLGMFILLSPAMADDEDSGGSILDRVAEILNVDKSTLEGAFDQAKDEHVDDLLNEGKISEEEAARMKEAEGFGFGMRGPHGKIHGMMEDLADYLGIEPSVIFESLRDGQTLVEVIETNGGNTDEIKAYLIQKVDERIDQALEDGKIDEDRAQEMKDKADERIDDFLSGEMPERPLKGRL